MKSNDVVKALAALAQSSRLEIFRALVVAGSAGLTPGALATSLGVAPDPDAADPLAELQSQFTPDTTRGARHQRRFTRQIEHVRLPLPLAFQRRDIGRVFFDVAGKHG